MLHIEREILQLADEAGVNGPQLPAPDCIGAAVDRLLQRRHLSADGGGRIEITEQGRAALADEVDQNAPCVDGSPLARVI